MNNPDNFDNDQQINIDPNELDQNNKLTNICKPNSNYKKINNYNIPSRKLNLKKHNINSIIENYRNNNINKNEYNTNKIESNSISKYLLHSRINRNKILKKENILNIDSITKSKINSFKNSTINDKYQSLIPNQKKLKSLKQVKNSYLNK